jgi:sulfate transporter 4
VSRSCYTTTGAFSRTAINSLAGAYSLLSSLVTGIFVMIILLVATPLFTHLSVNVQGAIVVVAVLPLFDFKSGWFYWETSKLDFLCWLVGYAVTALAGALPGIASAFGLSIAIVVLKNGFPRITKFGKLRGTELYRDPEQYPDVDVPEVEGVVIVRVEAPLFFGNLPVVQNHIEDEVTIRRARGEGVSVVILDMEMSPGEHHLEVA